MKCQNIRLCTQTIPKCFPFQLFIIIIIFLHFFDDLMRLVNTIIDYISLTYRCLLIALHCLLKDCL